MQKIFFSIIIPIYKVEKYLCQCLDSILRQEYKNFELILVDDGSPDNAPFICDEYQKKDDRVIVIHQKNSGTAVARKNGVVRSRGEYIMFIDGDDWICDNYILSFANIINEYQPEIVCCGHTNYYENGIIEKHPLPYMTGMYNKADIEKHFYEILIQKSNATYFDASIWGKVFKRELYLNNHLDDDVVVSVGQDGACTIPCVFNAKSIYVSDECLYCYRKNSSSVTKGKKVFNWEGPKIMCQHIARHIDINYPGMKEQIDRKVVHELFTVVLSQFNRNESYKTIKKDILFHLNDEYYHQAILNCSFKKSFKAKMMLFSLKHHLLFPIRIYCKTKKYEKC